jgi:hypothetical protein
MDGHYSGNEGKWNGIEKCSSKIFPCNEKICNINHSLSDSHMVLELIGKAEIKKYRKKIADIKLIII